MEIDIPEVRAEVSAVFARYQNAIIENDTAVLGELFWRSPHTLRYGVNENLYGWDEIQAFRTNRSPAGLAREIGRTVITTYGRDYATTNIEFFRPSLGKPGRQSQTWVRFPEGWRIVAAHVSLMAG